MTFNAFPMDVQVCQFQVMEAQDLEFSADKLFDAICYAE